MKYTFLTLGVAGILLLAACGDSSTSSTSTTEKMSDTGVSTSESTTGNMDNAVRYVDLNTGQRIQLHYDPETQVTMDMISGKPVRIYVDTETRDTFHTTGININNALLHTDAGWTVDNDKVKIDGDKVKIKSGDMKIKIDGDKMKVKDGDTKTKTDGNETKVKDGDTKMKTDGADSKTKTDDIKVKQEDGEIKVKDR
ncbi:MAG: hypothetical protein ABIQ56_01260 [Chitinophagaceae bacterium]